MSWYCLIISLKIIDKLVRNTENINYGGKKKTQDAKSHYKPGPRKFSKQTMRSRFAQW